MKRDGKAPKVLLAANLSDPPGRPLGWLLWPELRAHSWDWLLHGHRAARGARGLARGAPATDPYKGQHDPTWTLILFELALLKA